MRIEKGILQGARFVKAHSSGGDMNPRWIVLHDTAGALRPFSSVEWFASKECGTSAHFVIERDGTVTQMVPTNKRAFHAGVSSWKGVSGLNSCSVGIEIVNPGKLDEKGKADFGSVVAEPKDIVKKSSPAHGAGYWLPYTQEQINSVISLCRAIVEEYPDVNEIVTHYEIAPKRKIDVGPHFPLDEVRRAVFDPTPGEVEHLELEPTTPAPAPPSKVVVAATSPSNQLIGGSTGYMVFDWFFDLTGWIKARLDDLVQIASSTTKEADSTIAPLASLAKGLQINLGNFGFWILVFVLIAVLIRHTDTKHELETLKQGAKQ